MEDDNSKLSKKVAILRQGFLPIMVRDNYDTKMLVESMVKAGCTVVDYTCRRNDDRAIIPWIKKEFPEMTVLLGSLVDGRRASAFLSKTAPNFVTVEEAVDLGVDGLVSMLRFTPETYDKYKDDFIMIPCVETSNEALEQTELGADFIKINGNNPLGPNFITYGKGPTHGFIPFLVTGGLTDDRTIPYLKAGAAVVASGFDLVIPEKLRKDEAVSVDSVVRALKSKLKTVEEARAIYQPDLLKALEKNGVDAFGVAGWIH